MTNSKQSQFSPFHYFSENIENSIPVTILLSKVGNNKLMMVK